MDEGEPDRPKVRWVAANVLQEQFQRVFLKLRYVSRIIGDDLQQDVQTELTNLTALTAGILSEVCGQRLSAPQLQRHSRDILTNGDDGFETLACQLGLIDETSVQRSQRELCELLVQIEAAVNQPRASGRPKVSELLERNECDRRLDALRDLTERVAQGTLDWVPYQVAARRLIFEMRTAHLM